MNRTISLSWVLTLACLLAAGCQTYVNIPPQAGDLANHEPNGATVRKILVEAVPAALEDGGIQQPVQVMLPAGMNKLSYNQILTAIGDQAVSPFDEEAQASVDAVVFAKSVRIRGNLAEVDIARPIGDGIDQLVTVYLRWKPLAGWQAQRVHVWRGVPVDEAGMGHDTASP